MGTEPERLAAEINRRLGEETAGVIPTQLPIGVGTERDLVDLGPQTLVVAADADGLALGHDYRAAEEDASSPRSAGQQAWARLGQADDGADFDGELHSDQHFAEGRFHAISGAPSDRASS